MNADTPIPWASTHLDRREATVLEVLHDSIGCYATPPVSYLQLAARVPGFEKRHLDDLYSKREVVGLRTLRGSAFLMPVDLLPIVVPATRERNERAFGNYVEKVLEVDDYDTWAARVEDLLSDEIPRTVREIKDTLEPPEEDSRGLNVVINQMSTECRLVGTGEPKSWRSGRNAMTLWSSWLPDVDVWSPDVDHARTEVARLYLRSHGPATAGDLSWWAGLTATQAKEAIADCGAEDIGGGLFTVDGIGSAKPPPLRLIPNWDTLLVTWKDRSRLLDDDLAPFVYDRDGNATSVVLDKGEITGVWSLGSDDKRLEVRAAPFDRFTPSRWKAIETEAEIIGNLAGSEEVVVERCTEPRSLVDGPRNLFLRPLRDHECE
ncbi:MAG TPA: winged helix DNA-binding domain-containing protein [Acidimicrobiia bacterium]|nr:winged helix DNA-binding domain-containing protein [Acidimicrobiia bacterium]